MPSKVIQQLLRALLFWHTERLFAFLNLFLYDCVYDGNSRQIQDVARGAFYVGEVDRFVQSHLDRTDRFGDA